MKRSILQVGLLLLVPAVSLAQQEKPEPLTRGPVHEAFAEQVNMTPKPGMIVPRKPPEPIDEVPPEYRPEGDDIEWVSGYWGWDDERKDFLWISGVWRKIPPNRKWVAGSWHKTPKGYQWIAGFWNVGSGQPQKFLKAPPETLDNGPNSPAPTDNQFWVPGNWVFQNSAYRWSAGFWHTYQSDWIWIPSHYVWTPRGCIFVSGYWDYRLPSRGHLFAPVYFARRSYDRPIRFCPSLVISSRRLSLHLFVRPNYCHYYFGDYYGPSFVQRNIFPSYSYHARRHCYDPIFSFCRVHYHQRGINYRNRVRDWHHHMVTNANLRPPRTWNQQRNRTGNRLAQHTHLGNRYSNLIAQHRGKPYRQLTQAQRDRMRKRRRNQIASRQNRGAQPNGKGKKTDQPLTKVVRPNPNARRNKQKRLANTTGKTARQNAGRTRVGNRSRGVGGGNRVRTRAGKVNNQIVKKPAARKGSATATAKTARQNGARTRPANQRATAANRARKRVRRAKNPITTKSVPRERLAPEARVKPNSNARNRRAIRRAKTQANNRTPIRNSTKVTKSQQVIKKPRTQPANRRIQQPKVDKSATRVQRTIKSTTRPKYTNPRLWDPSRNRRKSITPTRKAVQSTRKVVRRPGRPTTVNSSSRQRLQSYQKAASQRRSGPSRSRATAPKKTTRARSSSQPRSRGRSSSSPSRSKARPPSRSRSRAAPSRSTRTYGRSRGSSRSSSRSSSRNSSRSSSRSGRSRPKNKK